MVLISFHRAALEFLRVSGQQPHILQVHDWHTAALPMLYWEVRGWHRLTD
jgi:glycogen synthase